MIKASKPIMKGGVNIMSEINNIKFLLDLEEHNLVFDSNFECDYVVLSNNVTAKRIHLKTTTEFIFCNCCGQIISGLHDYRYTSIKHYSCGQQPLIISIKKKRFHCNDCNTNVTENITGIDKNCFISNALKRSVTFSLKRISSLKDICLSHNVSYSTVYRSLEKVSHKSHIFSLPPVISFDEFRANTTEGKYAFMVVNPISKKILEILPDRKFASVFKYFLSFPREDRNKVKYIVSDLWEPYRQIIKKLFPRAIMIADKFHYQRVVGASLSNIRKRVCQDFDKSTAYQVKKNWKLLHLSFEKVKDDDRRFSYLLKRQATDYEILWYILRLDNELRDSYFLYQDFLSILSLESQEKQILQFEHWIKKAETSESPEMVNVSKTMKHWRNEIKASFIRYNGVCLNNAFIEGVNNKIKVIKRVSYGYRSFINFRKRIFLVFY
jgi:transposase